MGADKFAASITHVIRQWGKPMGEPVFKDDLDWAFRCYDRSNAEPDEARSIIENYGNKAMTGNLNINAAWNDECGFNPGGRKGAFGTTTKAYSASGYSGVYPQPNFTIIAIREIFAEPEIAQEPSIFTVSEGFEGGDCLLDLEQGVCMDVKNPSAQASNPPPGTPAFSWMEVTGARARMNGASLRFDRTTANSMRVYFRSGEDSQIIASCFWDVRFYSEWFSGEQMSEIMEDMRENYRYYTGKDIEIPNNF